MLHGFDQRVFYSLRKEARMWLAETPS